MTEAAHAIIGVTLTYQIAVSGISRAEAGADTPMRIKTTCLHFRDS